jgi:flavin reductase (DIM6/NTAB) family NADH-FMN oxidoreductase RutF
MDADAKKTALRMIPYGLYVLTAENEGQVAAATVNWVTQTSFAPPLVAVALKTDSGAYKLVKQTKAFVLNMLGPDQGKMAFTFFKPAQKDGDRISGHAFKPGGTTGVPILMDCPAYLECKVAEIAERGDHHTVIGEVVNAGLAKPIAGRPDEAVLHMRALGPNVFYGG